MVGKTYIFFGNVGAGKGTQVELLSKLLTEKTGKKVVYISPGVEFRKFVAGTGYSNVLAKEILDRGNLLPDFLTISMFANVITRELQNEDEHLFVDGYPRTVVQVAAFESAEKFYSRKDSVIIYLKISKEEAVKRLMVRGRHDDTDKGIANRFEEYERNVTPALELMREKGYTTFEINGEQAIDAVHNDIKKALEI